MRVARGSRCARRARTSRSPTFPTRGDRIKRGLAYGRRQPAPSLTPTGAGERGVIDRHRSAVLAGGWAWGITLAWVLGVLHPGGMIH